MYVITGATGKTGKPIAEALLAAGKEVRVIARREERLKLLEKKGATILVGDLADEQFLLRAFKGATAIYAMIPPDYRAADYRAHQLKIAAAITVAVKNCAVPHVVTLSSIGAHLPEGNGVVQGLYEFEQMLNRIPQINVLHLRPSYFMENFMGQIGAIRDTGVMASPVRGDLPIPLVSARDVADVAVRRLVALDFTGKSVQFLLGPRDYTFRESAGVIGGAIGKPDLSYVELPYAEAEAAMTKRGFFSADVARRLVEFMKGLNEGGILGAQVRDAQSTTSTSLEEFAKGLTSPPSSR